MSDDDPLARHLQAITARFERCLGERAALLRQTAAALELGEDGAADALRVAAHRLKGIAGSCGHGDLGALAAEVEAAAADGATDAVAKARSLADEADARAGARLRDDPVPWVVWIEPDPDLHALTTRQLARRDDLDASVLAGADALTVALASRRRPAAVVVDVEAKELRRASALCSAAAVPVVALVDPGETCGDDAVVERPAGPVDIGRVARAAVDAVKGDRPTRRARATGP